MASGHPDWGQAQQTGLIATVSDLGELAARLGSIDVYFRTGNVIFLDDFENGINAWRTGTLGAASAVATSTTTCYRGATSVKISSGTDAGSFAFISKNVTPQVVTKMAVECMVAFDSPNGYFDLSLSVTHSLTQYVFKIRYDETNNQLFYYNAAGVPTLFATAPALLQKDYIFHVFKLVVDPLNVKYLRLYIDQVLYDLSAFAPQAAGAVDSDYLNATIRSTFKSAGNAIVYVDCPIITINEP